MENLRLCQRGKQNERMVIERVFSMLTVVNHFKKIFHQAERYLKQLKMRLITSVETSVAPMTDEALTPTIHQDLK